MITSISFHKKTSIPSLHTTTISHPLPLTSLQCGSLFQSLTNSKSLPQGLQLHAHILTAGTHLRNTYLLTKLAAFYANCGQMAAAHVAFDGVLLKNSFLWNSMIRGYACCGMPSEVLDFYVGMGSVGRKADSFTFPFVIKACGDVLGVGVGREVHGRVVVGGFERDVYVGNSLIAMYGKFGDVGLARKVFDRMSGRDLISWNAVISSYVKNGEMKEALAMFHLMKRAGLVADSMTLLGLISTCDGPGNLEQGKKIHGYVVRNYHVLLNGFLNNSLIEMYCKCNSIVNARKLFEKLSSKDTVAWNSMIAGYARNGDAFESLRIFCRMVGETATPDQVTFINVLGACHPITALHFGMSVHSCLAKRGFGATTVVGTAVVDMYAKCGSLACSRLAFNEMSQKNFVTWSAMISGYGVHGRGREAISLFHEMIRQNIIPDEGILTSLLSACSHAGMVVEGKEIFYKMTKEYNLKPGLSLYSCLVDLLGRAGNLDEAYELIKTMEVNPTSDIWATLLNACRIHRNIGLAEIIAEKILHMNEQQVGSYICLSNIYAAEKRWDDVDRVRALMRGRGLNKPPGCSLVELDKSLHRFLVGDKSHRQMEEIYAKLDDLRQLLQKAGYKPDTSSVFYNVDEEVKEKMIWDHSEKLAIAFALINTSPGTIIRITKNLRVCGDCHTITKLISKLMHREIIMRDIRRFHHFKDGLCSCGDSW